VTGGEDNAEQLPIGRRRPANAARRINGRESGGPRQPCRGKSKKNRHLDRLPGGFPLFMGFPFLRFLIAVPASPSLDQFEFWVHQRG
jgi:hypothetical protein